MKIYELFNEDADAYKSFQAKLHNTAKRSTIGMGRENTAYEKHGRPDVYKVGQSNEGGSLFMKALAKSPEMRNNPYFPKVKAARSINGGLQVSAVERLLPISTLKTWDEIKPIWAQLYGKQKADAIVLSTKLSEPVQIRSALDSIAENLSWYLAWGEPIGPSFAIVDQQFIQAAKFISQIKAEAKSQGLRVRADSANVENFMLRKTAGGYQLVLSDPLTSNQYAKNAEDY